MVVLTCIALASTSTASAALAAVVLEASRNTNVLELIGLRQAQTVIEGCDRLECFIWTGSRWTPCTVALHGDVLRVAGRHAVGEEAFILACSQTSEIDVFVTILLKANKSLKLRFDRADMAANFGEQVRIASGLARDMSELADQVVERRHQIIASRSASTLRSQDSRHSLGRRSTGSLPRRSPSTRDVGVGGTPRTPNQAFAPTTPSPSKESPSRKVPPLPLQHLTNCHENSEGRLATRRELHLPPHVPMFAMSPSPPGCDHHLEDDGSPESPQKASRKSRSSHAHSSSEPDLTCESNLDESSFASQVFMGLGLSPAKLGVEADTRVSALMTRFGEELSPMRSRPSRSASQPTIGTPRGEGTAGSSTTIRAKTKDTVTSRPAKSF